jgi:hypothetical protein
MRIHSKYRLIAIQVFASICIFELLSALLLISNVRRIFPLYLAFSKSVNTDHGRGYPRFHLQNHDQRGFDIAPNGQRVLTSSKPSEGDPYYVWGNSIGCFDKPPPVGIQYGVYLAGDSFTWGYTPFDKKFGTLLEKKLNIPIAKCGVTHTGQRHQFSKFKDIVQELGYYPRVVVVNVVFNDADNDYHYPHSKVIDGYQVEDVQWRIKNINKIETQRLGIKKLTDDYNEYLDKPNNNTWRTFDPRRLSATFALAGKVSKRIISVVKPTNNEAWIRSPYGISRRQARVHATYDSTSETSKKNLDAISKWIADSKSNGYRLIFSLIPDKTGYNFSGLKKYISSSGGEVYDFTDYIGKSTYSGNAQKLYWEIDGHFNPSGDRLYSEFLHEKIVSGN